MAVRQARAGAQAPAPAAAAHGLEVDRLIVSRPEDDRRLAAGAGRAADAHALVERRAAVVAERRVLRLAGAQVVLHRGRNGAQVVERADVARRQPGRLELAAEERDRPLPDALEQRLQALELQRRDAARAAWSAPRGGRRGDRRSWNQDGHTDDAENCRMTTWLRLCVRSPRHCVICVHFVRRSTPAPRRPGSARRHELDVHVISTFALSRSRDRVGRAAAVGGRRRRCGSRRGRSAGPAG